MTPLANTLTNVFNDSIVLTGLSIIVAAFVATLIAVLWLTHLYRQLKSDYARLAATVDGNKNDIFGLCSAALTVNGNTATIHEQLHDLKQQLTNVVEKINELQQRELVNVNSPYNVDIRKIRDGASIGELMHQSDLSYDEAALLIRLHGGKKPD